MLSPSIGQQKRTKKKREEKFFRSVRCRWRNREKCLCSIEGKRKEKIYYEMFMTDSLSCDVNSFLFIDARLLTYSFFPLLSESPIFLFLHFLRLALHSSGRHHHEPFSLSLSLSLSLMSPQIHHTTIIELLL